MKKHTSSIFACMLAAVVAGCGAVRDGMESHQQAVARVDGFILTVEHAAELLASANEDIAPAVPVVSDPLIDLWVGYTLLAIEFASSGSFSNVDLAPIIGTAGDQELVWNLHDDVVMARVVPPEPQLREQYERERPFDAVKAQHILVAVPTAATPQETDSLRRVAENIRAQLLAGADFDQLAREYSDDPATAANGGRLGWVPRDRLVADLEEILFKLEPGVISETVRSSSGYHILKVIEREAPDFEDANDRYRAELIGSRMTEVESEYINALIEEANIRFAPGAVNLARSLAVSPKLERLSPAERSAAIARYKGGVLTVGEFADFVIQGSPNSRSAFAGADSAQAHALLFQMVRSELLAKAARDEGYRLTQEQADSLRDDAIRQLSVAVTVSGFSRDQLVSDEAVMAAVDRAVTEVLTRQRSPRPMERVAPFLRTGHTIQVYPNRFSHVSARLAEIRLERGEGQDQAVAPAQSRPAAENTAGTGGSSR